MRITLIGHASILIEANGVSLLSDPWWAGPCFGAQWWIYPAPQVELARTRKLDYIYLSHGHHDHFHPGTLTRFDRSTEILVSSKGNLRDTLRRLGFTVHELAPADPTELRPGLRVRIIPTHGGDTLMTIADGHEVCINANDALHSVPEEMQDRLISQMRAEHPAIDYVFCGYGTASHFPNCYYIPGKNMEATAARRQHYFNSSWVRIMNGLAPSFGFPFASDLAFLENDLIWVNEPVHNTERPTDLFRRTYPGHQTQVIDIGPGFCIDKHQIQSNIIRPAISNALIKRSVAVNIEQANRYPRTSHHQVEELRNMLMDNVQRRQGYLETFPGSYRFLVSLKNSDTHLEVAKSRRKIEVSTIKTPQSAYDVTLTTRGNYLRNSIRTEFGWEVLFVGSGCQVAYQDRELVAKNLHRELFNMIICPTRPLAPRYGDQSRAAYEAKRIVKKILGRSEDMLYDLEHWTEYRR